MLTLDETALLTLLSLGNTGSPDLFNKIFKLFEDNSPDLIKKIQSAYASGDNESVRAATHSLKSSAAYLGGTDLSDHCRDIEKAAKNDRLQELHEVIVGLDSCFEQTRLSINAFVELHAKQNKAA